MKKIGALKIILCLSALFVVLVSLVACEQTGSTEKATVQKIEVESAPETPYIKDDPNLYLGDVVLKATYTNQKEVRFTLEDSMLSGEDRRKFYEQAGRYTVAVNYDGGVGYYEFEVVELADDGTYLVSFYSRGGSEVKSKACKTVDAFTLPEREGYTFDGWYADVTFTEDGKVAQWGKRAVSPYTVTKNTAFYAKWIDNRVCTVKFLDDDGTILYEEKIHYGEKIDVNSFAYPEDKVVSGKTFVSWNITGGDPDEVTTDMTIKATFRFERCTLRIVYANTDGKATAITYEFDYGTPFDVGNYVVPVKEGYDSRFVVYYFDYDETDKTDKGEEYSELPDDNRVVLTEKYTTICPRYEILTYDITIWNGKETQTYENLKKGEIELEKVYENADSLKSFSSVWNGDFDFSEHKQDPNIGSPTTLKDENGNVGYKSEWCFVVTDAKNNEVWYNYEGFIWNKEKQIFEAPTEREDGDTAGEWTLRDADKNYIAVIKGGKLTAIKHNVTVKALYTKKTYDVKLVRQENGTQRTLVTFKVKYLSDFDPYDVASYPHKPTESETYEELDVKGYTINDAALLKKTNTYDPSKVGTDIEKLYLKENTDFTVKKYATDGGYYSTSGESTQATEEDWSVVWYDNASFLNEPIAFNEGKTKEIQGATVLYCKDEDQRKYDLYFYYDYDFAKGSYKEAGVNPVVGQQAYKENEKINMSTPENVTCTINGVTVTYTFIGWYDVSYKTYLETGNRGNLLADGKSSNAFSSRKSSTYYYAHYESTGDISVKIYDKTQSTAYIGKSAEYAKYGVADNTIVYTLPKGTNFDLSMVYKGTNAGTSTNVSGQYYYNAYKKNTFFVDIFEKGNYEHTASDGTTKTIQIIDKEDGINGYLQNRFGSDSATTIKDIRLIVDEMTRAYKDAVSSLYDHNYKYTADEYQYYLTEFADKQKSEIVTLKSEYEKITGKGGSVAAAIKKVYSDNDVAELLDKLGNVSDFIDFYVKLLKKLYDNGFTDKHTGLNGIGFGTKDEYKDENVSTYDKLLIVSNILAEYEGLLSDKKNYLIQDVTPRYDASVKDLNEANGYEVSDPKYVFSGWYLDSAYTTSYQSDFAPLSCSLDKDITLYAKWTDVTKGTEGLVYEEVSVIENGKTINGYVIVDFVNKKQYDESGYSGSEYYYVTTNDAGNIPVSITGDIALAIPATIDKYIDKTAAALNESNWGEAYTNYLIRKSDGSYIPATAERNASEKYYVKEEYPVIGIKSGALDRYAAQVKEITIPLNLYYVEDGAFKNCNAASFEQIAAKDGEKARGTVFVDSAKRGIYGVATPLEVEGKVGYKFTITSEEELTIKAYAVGSADTTYSLQDDTKRIGDYAFAGATNIVTVNNTSAVKYFGERAFSLASRLEAFDDGKLKIPKTAETIGAECFAQCSGIKDVSVDSGANLSFVGKDAFIKTGWFESQKGIVSLGFTDADGHDTVIIIGYYSNSFAERYYDKDNDKNVILYDDAGTDSPTGKYYGITNGFVTVLIGIDGGEKAKVIINCDVKFIAPNAFDTLDARYYEFQSVKAIGDKAFASCANLKTIYINGSYFGVLTLGQDVFYGNGTGFKVVFSSKAVKDVVFDEAMWNGYNITIEP